MSSSSVVFVCGAFETAASSLPSDIYDLCVSCGCRCHIVELYQGDHFGAYSFLEEIERVTAVLRGNVPDLVIGHSLGAYTALQARLPCEHVLLDPSLSIDDMAHRILARHDGRWVLENEGSAAPVSDAFVHSLSHVPSVPTVAQAMTSTVVHVIAAGKGGWKVARQYYSDLPSASYTLLPNADHNFSRDRDRLCDIISGHFNMSHSVDS